MNKREELLFEANFKERKNFPSIFESIFDENLKHVIGGLDILENKFVCFGIIVDNSCGDNKLFSAQILLIQIRLVVVESEIVICYLDIQNS